MDIARPDLHGVTHEPRYAEHARREIHLFDGKCSPHPTDAAGD